MINAALSFCRRSAGIIGSFLLCGAVLSLPCVAAEPPPSLRPVFLSRRVDLGFNPEEIVFLVRDSAGNLRKVRAVAISANNLERHPGEASRGEWLLGTKLHVAPSESLSFAALVRGPENQFRLFAADKQDGREAEIRRLGTSELRQLVEDRRVFLANWELQVRSQDEQLRRLRDDADSIANVGRIVDVLEEIESAKQESASIQQHIESMRVFLRQGKLQKAPKSFAVRELELTKQLAELAAVGKGSGAGSKDKASPGADVQRKLSLVEETRFDDEEKLRDELSRLRGSDPEANGGGAAQTGSSYWELE